MVHLRASVEMDPLEFKEPEGLISVTAANKLHAFLYVWTKLTSWHEDYWTPPRTIPSPSIEVVRLRAQVTALIAHNNALTTHIARDVPNISEFPTFLYEHATSLLGHLNTTSTLMIKIVNLGVSNPYLFYFDSFYSLLIG